MQPKFIVVTGGVISGLGKGIAAASIGNIFSKQHTIIPIKCDGYLNVDPGTMNPIEHGEVFVLDDGSEVDMDFGHYERYLHVSCTGDLNLTMGKVFQGVRQKERRGDYLGKTVQFIPHVSDYIQQHFLDIAKEKNAQIMLIEVGGTVGDIENELYLEAVRSLPKKVGRENVFYVHLTYVPIPNGVDEQKTKPTQQSIALLKQKGIFPDCIIARCSEMLTEQVRDKIAAFCDVEPEAIITGVDVDSVYKIPAVFDQQGLGTFIAKHLDVSYKPGFNSWGPLLEKKPQKAITIAIAGKYTALEDSYASVVEALKHAGLHHGCQVNIRWIETSNGDVSSLQDVDGVIVPGGFGTRGVEGKITVIKYCRENNIPFLGICYGLQLAVIEFARSICQISDANSTEITAECTPVVDILEEQKSVTQKGGTMRLGAYPAKLDPESKIYSLYKQDVVEERHRHRYEVNPEFHQILQKHGLQLCGLSPDGTLAEFIELPTHPYFVATQAHPELKSSLSKPAPLFYGLVQAALKR
ncbi:MAG: glutamine hydrolyzing CTP synthase [Candidatus Woesearchaeota archaeon]